MSRPLSRRCLHLENLAFAGTAGVSANGCKAQFVPAFKDPQTGRVEVARLADGRVASFHSLDCLPDEWAEARDATGRVCALKCGIVAGFVRQNVFYTREQAASMA